MAPSGVTSWSLGRDLSNDLVLDDAQVSRFHCRVIHRGGKWLLEDLGSTNHTYVNGHRLKANQPELFNLEDEVRLGRCLLPVEKLEKLGRKDAKLAEEVTRLSPAPGRESRLASPDTITIGRDPGCSLHLDNPLISWRHAILHPQPGGYRLEDLNSTNGTFLMGERVTRAEVAPGDAILLGPYTLTVATDLEVIARDWSRDIRVDADDISVMVGPRSGQGDLVILKDVSLTIHPSEMVGVIGPSGAGKTTLLKALNGYRAPDRGQCYLNGLSLYENYDRFRHMVAYVPQDDIIHGDLTVYEALYYAAKIRLPPDTSKAEINQRIDDVLGVLGLLDAKRGVDLRASLIGSPSRPGLSGGQRKRVSLAMELLSDPSLLLLDEPTSGLSSEDARVVMDHLRGLADSGKTVAITLHQPGLEVFKKLDSLVVLAGGELAYFGPAHPEAILFFNPGDQPEEVRHNPDFALAGLQEGEANGVHWPSVYQDSQHFSSHILGRKEQRPGKASGHPGSGRPPRPFGLGQWWALTQRYLTIKRRDVLGSAILLLQAPVIAGLIAMVYYGSRPPHLVPLFLLVLAALWLGTSNASREIVAEAAIYTRERMINLKIPSYLFSKFTVQCGFCLAQCLVLVGGAKLFLDIDGAFWALSGAVFLASAAGLCLGLFVSALTKSPQQALALVPLLLLPMVILGGGMIPAQNMNQISWIAAQAMPSRWAYEQVIQVEETARRQRATGLAPRMPTAADLCGCPGSLVRCLYGQRRARAQVPAMVLLFISGGLLGAAGWALKRRDLL